MAILEFTENYTFLEVSILSSDCKIPKVYMVPQDTNTTSQSLSSLRLLI